MVETFYVSIHMTSFWPSFKRSITRDVGRSSAFGHIFGLAPDSSPHNSWTSGVIMSGFCGVGSTSGYYSSTIMGVDLCM